MIRLVKIATFLLSFALLTSCINKTNDNNKNLTAIDHDITYDIEGEVVYYSVDDDGKLYCIANQLYEEGVPNSKLIIADIDGNILQSKDFWAPYYETVYVKNGVFYVASYPEGNDRAFEMCISTLNFETGEFEVLYNIREFFSVRNMVVIDNIIYFIGVEAKSTAKDYKQFKMSDNYFYRGELISSINLETGDRMDIDVGLPISFNETENGNLLIYAYDENGGYYFEEYNPKTGMTGNKIYKQIRSLDDDMSYFTVNGNGELIIRENMMLKLIEITSDAVIELKDDVVDVFKYKFMEYKKGFIYYLTDNRKIRRIDLSKIFRSSITLNMGYTDKYASFPDNYGYHINQKALNYDEFALSVLSGDSDFDFYLINSRHSFADNIRNKGAYYKLNDVDGVSLYIDSIFEYAKEAAVNYNKDVWMIPVSLYTSVVEYNEKVWDRYEIDINSVSSLNKLVDTIYQFAENEIDESYWLNSYEIIEKYFYQIIEKNNGFNREEFKNMAEYCYEKLNFVKNNVYSKYGILLNSTTKTDDDSTIGGLYNAYIVDGKFYPGGYSTSSIDVSSIIIDEDYDNYSETKSKFFSTDNTRSSFATENYINLRRIVLPNVENFDQNDFVTEFFYVNPNSKNLETVLDFISTYCNERLSERNSFILKNKSTYDDRVFINDIYDVFNRKGYVRFGLDSELYYDDFVKFLSDEITLDEYLDRVEYKLNAYLNE